MKKFTSWLLCLTLVMSLAGCGTQTLDNPSLQKGQSESSAPTQGTEAVTAEDGFNVADEKDALEPGFNVDEETAETMDFSKYEEDKYHTSAVPEGQQAPVNVEDQQLGDTYKTCYLSIYCNTILDNMDMLAEGKEVLIPEDGVILGRTEVTFQEGESVFNILQRETRDRLIHMSFRDTPMYNSAYIEGIHNLYEFDCGSESGWMYCVNGWFPNYGVSRYQVQEGDEIEFHYTCDLGRDVGDQYWDDFQ